MTSSLISSQVSYGKLWFCVNLSDFGSRATHRCCHKGLRRFFSKLAKFLFFFSFFSLELGFSAQWPASRTTEGIEAQRRKISRLLYKSVLICICIRLADNRDYTLSNRRSDYFSSFQIYVYGTDIFAYLYLPFSPSLFLFLSLFFSSSLLLLDFSYTLRDDRSVLQTIDSRPSTTRPPSCSYKLSDVPTSNRARGTSSCGRSLRRAPSRVSQLGSRLSCPPLFLSLSLWFLSPHLSPPLFFFLLFSPGSFAQSSLRGHFITIPPRRLCRCPSAKLNDRVFRAPAQLRYPSAIDITMLRYRDAILRHFRDWEQNYCAIYVSDAKIFRYSFHIAWKYFIISE